MQFTSDAEAEYTGVVLKANKRFSNNWLLDASYTWSDAKDNDSNERSVSSSSDYPEDQYNLDGDWGPSNFDVEHKFVASFAWQLPLNFMVSAIGYYRSGYRFTAGDSRDNNGDGYTNASARSSRSRPGSSTTTAATRFRQPDRQEPRPAAVVDRTARRQPRARAHREVFNVLNGDNFWSSETSLTEYDGSINPDFRRSPTPVCRGTTSSARSSASRSLEFIQPVGALRGPAFF